MNTLSKNAFLDTVNDGRVFTVDFIKRTNGERRLMNCRRGVTKGVTGKGLAFDPEKKDLLTVYDMQKSAHRMINLEDLVALKANGKNYVWSTHDEVFVETVKD